MPIGRGAQMRPLRVGEIRRTPILPLRIAQPGGGEVGQGPGGGGLRSGGAAFQSLPVPQRGGGRRGLIAKRPEPLRGRPQRGVGGDLFLQFRLPLERRGEAIRQPPGGPQPTGAGGLGALRLGVAFQGVAIAFQVVDLVRAGGPFGGRESLVVRLSPNLLERAQVRVDRGVAAAGEEQLAGFVLQFLPHPPQAGQPARRGEQQLADFPPAGEQLLAAFGQLRQPQAVQLVERLRRRAAEVRGEAVVRQGRFALPFLQGQQRVLVALAAPEGQGASPMFGAAARPRGDGHADPQRLVVVRVVVRRLPRDAEQGVANGPQRGALAGFVRAVHDVQAGGAEVQRQPRERAEGEKVEPVDPHGAAQGRGERCKA
ncbi:hypothetical protein LzC2_41090 [Planctomycetes bacterium LzC2]|uniref:Uncharacterized protein n=1 Tax=Alienimonas chondri TaxID=2681879 RepID=A0ABX1VMU2_9PLAN|nr:hypothetical protein [Alienimonas chondri]